LLIVRTVVASEAQCLPNVVLAKARTHYHRPQSLRDAVARAYGNNIRPG
jgi:hypothetical protein